MAHLYLNADTDSVYLDVTAGDGDPANTAEPAKGVYLHMDESGVLVGMEVADVSRRGDLRLTASDMGHLHVNPNTDSLYLDVSAGTRPPVKMAAVADGVNLHVDEAGALVAIEVMDLSERGGLHVDDLDAPPGALRPAIFDEIELTATRRERPVTGV